MYTTIISAQDLATHIDHPRWVVLDCRHDLMDATAGKKAYDSGHLPHARFAHLDRDLSGVKTSVTGTFHGRHPLPMQKEFIHTLRSWGIDHSTQVIAYDAHGGMFAARLWWLLRSVGHAAVAVLDGSMQAWQSQGFLSTTDVPKSTHGSIQLRTSLVKQVNASEVLANLATMQRTIVDARSPDRFRGENETIDPVAGHIPGAKNRFFKENLHADGRFKSAEELRSEWRLVLPDVIENDDKNGSRSIMQCGSGVTACHNLLALEIAGLSDAALYPGSWSEWCADPSRPVALG